MGNLCGKQSSGDDYFTLPGRTLGSAGGGGGGGGGVSAQRAGLPKASTGGTHVYGQGQGQAPRSRQSQSQSQNQGRTIGSEAASGNAANSPREAAARAAEVS